MVGLSFIKPGCGVGWIDLAEDIEFRHGFVHTVLVHEEDPGVEICFGVLSIEGMDVAIDGQGFIHLIVVLEKVGFGMPGGHVFGRHSYGIVEILDGKGVVCAIHQITEDDPGFCEVRISFDSRLKSSDGQVGLPLVAIDHTQHK